MHLASKSRPLDPAEHYFWLLDQSACMNFVVFAEIDKQPSPEQLNTALTNLSKKVALLRTSFQVSTDNQLHFRVNDTSDIKVEVHQTDDANWLTPIEAELNRIFSAKYESLVRCLMISVENTERSIIALTFHHSLADGRTGIKLLKQLLVCLEELDQITNVEQAAYKETLSPGLHQLFPDNYRWENKPDELSQMMSTRREELKRFGKPDELTDFCTEGKSRQAKIHRIVLSEPETTKLMNICKTNRCSVHGALAAAQLIAIQQSESVKIPLTLSLTTPADLRAYLNDPHDQKSSDLLGLYISMLSANYRIEPDTDFWQLAKEISSDVKRHLNRGDGHLLYQLFQPLSFSTAEQDVQRFTNAVNKSNQSALISNLGHVVSDTASENDWVRSISFALCPMPTQTMFAAISTYKQQLNVNLNFDIGKMPEALASQISQQFKLIVTSLA